MLILMKAFMRCLSMAASDDSVPWRGPVKGDDDWYFKDLVKSDDPFPPKTIPNVTILDVAGGWVRYKINEKHPDERAKVSAFVYYYKRIPKKEQNG